MNVAPPLTWSQIGDAEFCGWLEMLDLLDPVRFRHWPLRLVRRRVSIRPPLNLHAQRLGFMKRWVMLSDGCMRIYRESAPGVGALATADCAPR